MNEFFLSTFKNRTESNTLSLHNVWIEKLRVTATATSLNSKIKTPPMKNTIDLLSFFKGRKKDFWEGYGSFS
jgi:hypothetical protein